MLVYILENIITDTFEHQVGRNQAEQETPKAMWIQFHTSIDHDNEVGYRYRELLIFAEHNYIGVYTRDRWCVAGIEDEDYVEGENDWEVLSYHDSCWRTDGVRSFLLKYEDNLLTIGRLCQHWFEIKEMSEEEIAHLKDRRHQKYNYHR
ncbi:MAG: hypothetical protein DWQ19_09295 [Crenarchaeota archaeon]|nr:MAG: hypothetical protein DWQ19_09295 [Thermoproteota archaeon]